MKSMGWLADMLTHWQAQLQYVPQLLHYNSEYEDARLVCLVACFSVYFRHVHLRVHNISGGIWAIKGKPLEIEITVQVTNGSQIFVVNSFFALDKYIFKDNYHLHISQSSFPLIEFQFCFWISGYLCFEVWRTGFAVSKAKRGNDKTGKAIFAGFFQKETKNAI